jgi:hypothetical protein
MRLNEIVGVDNESKCAFSTQFDIKYETVSLNAAYASYRYSCHFNAPGGA